MVGDNLILTSNSKIDLARLPPSFRDLLPQIYRVNHGLAFYQRADELFIEAPSTYGVKQGWLKNQNNLLEPIWQVGSFLPSALVHILGRVRAKTRAGNVH